MIIKIKSHKRDAFQKILEYMMNERDRVLDQNGNTFLITHNLKGKIISDWVKQFQQNELLRTYRRKDSVRLTHEILSWHRKDATNITLQKMENIAREYIKHRNPKGLYVIIPHFDKKHCHLHICASGVEYQTGKSLRLSKASLLKLKKDIQQYQKDKFPELCHSTVEHGRKNKFVISEKEYQFNLRTGRESDKERLIKILKSCSNNANSRENFYELLRDRKLKTYERGGQITGIIFNDQKFRFKRLGYFIERFDNLEKIEKRGKNVSELRRSMRPSKEIAMEI